MASLLVLGAALARSLVIEKMRCTNVKPAQYDIDIIKEQGIVFQPLP
jgi:hypothetical protein